MSREYGWYDDERCVLAPWRVGRKVPRNVYAQVAGSPVGSPSDDDVPIGSFDTDLLAARAVEDHNASLEGGDVE